MTTKNAMHRRAQEYLDERRRLGYALSTTGARLLAFARFAESSCAKPSCSHPFASLRITSL